MAAYAAGGALQGSRVLRGSQERLAISSFGEEQGPFATRSRGGGAEDGSPEVEPEGWPPAADALASLPAQPPGPRSLGEVQRAASSEADSLRARIKAVSAEAMLARGAHGRRARAVTAAAAWAPPSACQFISTTIAASPSSGNLPAGEASGGTFDPPSLKGALAAPEPGRLPPIGSADALGAGGSSVSMLFRLRAAEAEAAHQRSRADAAELQFAHLRAAVGSGGAGTGEATSPCGRFSHVAAKAGAEALAAAGGADAGGVAVTGAPSPCGTLAQLEDALHESVEAVASLGGLLEEVAAATHAAEGPPAGDMECLLPTQRRGAAAGARALALAAVLRTQVAAGVAGAAGAAAADPADRGGSPEDAERLCAQGPVGERALEAQVEELRAALRAATRQSAEAAARLQACEAENMRLARRLAGQEDIARAWEAQSELLREKERREHLRASDLEELSKLCGDMRSAAAEAKLGEREQRLQAAETRVAQLARELQRKRQAVAQEAAVAARAASLEGELAQREQVALQREASAQEERRTLQAAAGAAAVESDSLRDEVACLRDELAEAKRAAADQDAAAAVAVARESAQAEVAARAACVVAEQNAEVRTLREELQSLKDTARLAAVLEVQLAHKQREAEVELARAVEGEEWLRTALSDTAGLKEEVLAARSSVALQSARCQDLEARLADAGEQAAAAAERAEALEAQFARSERERAEALAEGSARAEALEERIAKQREAAATEATATLRLASLAAELSQKEQEAEVSSARAAAEMQERLGELRVELGAARAADARSAAAAEDLREELAQARAEGRQLEAVCQGQVAAAEAAGASAQGRLEASEVRASALAGRLAEARGELAEARKGLDNLADMEERLERRGQERDRELIKVVQDGDQLMQASGALVSDLCARLAEQRDLAAAGGETREVLAELADRLDRRSDERDQELIRVVQDGDKMMQASGALLSDLGARLAEQRDCEAREAALRVEVSALKEELEQSRDGTYGLRAALEQSLGEEKELKAQVAALSAELNESREGACSLQAEVAQRLSEEVELSARVAALTAELDRSRVTACSLQAIAERHKAEEAKLAARVAFFVTEQEQSREGAGRLQAEVDSQVNAARAELQELRDGASDLQAALERSVAEEKGLKARVASLDVELKESREGACSLRASVEQHQAQEAELTARVAVLTTELAQSREGACGLHATVERHRAEEAKVASRLASSSAELEQSREGASRLQDAFDKQAELVRSLEKAVARLEVERAGAEAMAAERAADLDAKAALQANALKRVTQLEGLLDQRESELQGLHAVRRALAEVEKDLAETRGVAQLGSQAAEKVNALETAIRAGALSFRQVDQMFDKVLQDF